MLVHSAVFKTDCDGFCPSGRFDSCAPPPLYFNRLIYQYFTDVSKMLLPKYGLNSLRSSYTRSIFSDLVWSIMPSLASMIILLQYSTSFILRMSPILKNFKSFQNSFCESFIDCKPNSLSMLCRFFLTI